MSNNPNNPNDPNKKQVNVLGLSLITNNDPNHSDNKHVEQHELDRYELTNYFIRQDDNKSK